MSPQLASLLCYAYIVWMFFKDLKRNREVSNALWIPLAWTFILGSKPVSVWLSGSDGLGGDDYAEGSPMDRNVFLALIVASVFVLMRRQLNWKQIFADNKWLFIFFGYLGLSIAWSDFPFVSFKRWIKDVGNILMILVVVTEADPVQAIRALLARTSYLLIPLSVLYVKYYPEIGRYYNRWTYQPYFGGVTTDKNILGITLFVCGLAMLWAFFTLYKMEDEPKDKIGMLGFGLLLAMNLWLLLKSQSSTALGSSIIAIALFTGFRIPAIRVKVRKMGIYGTIAIALVLLLHVTINLGGIITEALGRDLTFTGRTDIWKIVLSEDINPLLGTGYYSFWLGDRPERLSEGFFYQLNQAHNGYIETYVNSGLIGLFLLAMFFLSASRNMRNEVEQGSTFGSLRLAFLIVTLIYNITEATFDRLNLVWFVLLLLAFEYPRASDSTVSHAEEQEQQEEEFSPDVDAARDFNNFRSSRLPVCEPLH